MKITKKFLIVFISVLIIISGILPSFSYAGNLNDSQRKALVDVVVKIIDEGNKSRILRYSQGHRMVGYNWQKVQKSTKQLTAGYTNLSDGDLIKLTKILNESQGITDPDDYKFVCKARSYKCQYTGDDINDTIPFDCSSLVGAAYNMTVGTPYGGWAWNSAKYSEGSDWFDVTSDMSKRKPGDILWKEGHVAIYLGKIRGNGKEYIAEAFGFARISKKSDVMRQRLMTFLEANPTHIIEHPDHKNVKGLPVLQLPADGVMDVQQQVIIAEYKPNRFTKLAVYKGPISKGRFIDVTNLSTTNPGDGSGIGDDWWSGDGGLSHDPINLTGGHTVVWPEGLVLEDQILATSEGYFYKGTPTYGQYVGRVDLFNWLIMGTENVLDWLIGFVTYSFKAVMIGWTAILEDVMSSILNFGIEPASGATAAVTLDTVTDMNALKKINETETIKAYTKSEVGTKNDLIPITVLADEMSIDFDDSEYADLVEQAEKADANKNNPSSGGNTGGSPSGSQGGATTPGVTTPENNTSGGDSSNSNSGSTTGATTNGSATNNETSNPNANKVTAESALDASESKKKINIEDILFNRVPVLDINFFDFENAGGEKLSEGSLLYKIRETIASWYYIIRMAIIMGMLVTLLYIGIKIAISVPGKKAEYKAKLIDWIVGFIIVFSMHYFMVIVINLNNQIVKVLDPIISESTTVNTPDVDTGSSTNVVTTNDGQTSLYEAIRIQSYDIKATTGITATVMYMVLVFFTIRFVILYAKRLFILALLTVISPIMGLLYSINKKKYKIGDWGKEYIYNVLIQVVHVVIYTSIVGLAFDVSTTSTFRGGIIALMTLGFLFVAEGMVKKIFGFDKSSSGGSLMNSSLGQIAAVGVIKSIYDKTQEKTSKAIAGQSKPVNWLANQYNKRLQNNISVSDWQNRYAQSQDGRETEEEARQRRANRALDSSVPRPNTVMLRTLGGNEREYIVDKDGVPITPYDEYEVDPERKNYFTMSQINNVYADVKKEENQARRAYALQGAKDIFNSVTGSFSLMAAIPMLVISPKYGLGLGAYGIHGMASSMGRRKIKGARPTGERKKWTGSRLVFAWATAGASEAVSNMYNNSEDTNYMIETTYPKRLEILEQARKEEDAIARAIVDAELSRSRPQVVNGQETERVRAARERLDELSRNMDKQEFEKAVNLTLEELKKKDIEKIVEKYIIQKETGEVTDKDIAFIVKELEKTVGEKCKDVTLNNNFSEVIREEVRERIVTTGEYVVVGMEEKYSNTARTSEDTSTRESTGYTGDDIRDRYSRNAHSNSTENSNTEQFFNNASTFTNTGQNASSTRNTSSDNRNMPSDNRATPSDNTQQRRRENLHLRDNDDPRNPIQNRITKRELEEKVDNVMKHMGQEELLDVLESALKRKEAFNREIKNPRYVEIMARVENLKKLDAEYKELTGESIYKKYENVDGQIVPKKDKDGDIEYQSISSLIKEMRNYLVDSVNGRA